MSGKPKVILSLDRFLKFLETHDYALTSVYCENNEIRFAECRTPHQQKTFIVHVPEKYSLTPGPADTDLKKIDVTKEESELDGRQIKYLSDLKGPLLECDLLAISSSNICMYKNTGETGLYSFGSSAEETEQDSESEEEIEEEDFGVAELERDAAVILEKVNPGTILPKAKERIPDVIEIPPPEVELSEIPEASPKGESPKGESPKGESPKGESPKGESPKGESPKDEPEEPECKVELVFQDPDGDSIEDIKELIPDENNIDDAPQVNKKGVDRVDLGYTTRDNSLPSGIEYSDVFLGIVYPMIDVGPFFRKVKTYEKEVISICEQVDDNVLDIRKAKLKDIRELSTAFLKHSEARLEKINEEEKSLRTAMIRLTIILTQTDILRKKVLANPEKLGDEIPSVERLYNQTRKAIHELNIELLRLQDTADELLSNYSSSIKELMDL